MLDAAGDTLVADDLENHVDVFGPDGSLLRTIGSGTGPGGLSFPTGPAISGSRLYVADGDHSRVVAFDLASGKPVGYWPTSPDPATVRVDASGALYVLTSSGILTKYEPG